MKKFLCWAGLVAAIIFVVVMPRILDEYFAGDATPNEPRATVLTAWHVDTFEGGIGSRQDFLMKTAIEFERENKGVYVHIVKHTEESVADSFSKGLRPDIISFGNGVDGVLNYAKPLKTQVNNQFFSSATVDGRVYFYPYAYGVYATFAVDGASGDGTVISKGQNNLPLFLALKENLVGGDCLPCIEAYTRLVSGKCARLLGTQRDAYRLLRRGLNFSVEAHTAFTDLVQYVAVTSGDDVKAELSIRFAEFLLSKKTQERLGEIGLFSPLGVNVDYGEEAINKLAASVPKGVLSAVIPPAERKTLLSNDGEKDFFEKFEEYVRY